MNATFSEFQQSLSTGVSSAAFNFHFQINNCVIYITLQAKLVFVTKSPVKKGSQMNYQPRETNLKPKTSKPDLGPMAHSGHPADPTFRLSCPQIYFRIITEVWLTLNERWGGDPTPAGLPGSDASGCFVTFYHAVPWSAPCKGLNCNVSFTGEGAF